MTALWNRNPIFPWSVGKAAIKIINICIHLSDFFAMLLAVSQRLSWPAIDLHTLKFTDQILWMIMFEFHYFFNTIFMQMQKLTQWGPDIHAGVNLTEQMPSYSAPHSLLQEGFPCLLPRDTTQIFTLHVLLKWQNNCTGPVQKHT